MKKTTIAILGIAFATAIAIPAFALGLGNAPVQAQANPLSQRVCATLSCMNAAGDCPGSAGCYVDDNGDGICDNCTDGYGAGNGYGLGAGSGNAYTDDDGDGVCDNYANRGDGSNVGNGNGYGAGAGNGPCYTDDNGDGVCDNYAGGAGNGSGAGTGSGGAGHGHHGGGHHGAHC